MQAISSPAGSPRARVQGVPHALLPLLGAVVGLAGCGGRETGGPRWTALAEGFTPAPLIETARAWTALDPDLPRTVALPDDAGAGVWIELELPPSSWTADELPGLWWAPRPAHGGFRFAQGPVRLRAGERSFERVLETKEPEPGQFVLTGERIRLFLGEGEPLPAEVTFGVEALAGLPIDGFWRVRAHDQVGDGIPVWSGEREELVRDVAPRSRLSFVTLFSPTAPDAPAATFRVLLDGTPLWTHEQSQGVEAHALELPAAGAARARLAFEVEGPPGLGVFYDPVVGPAELGSYGDRPWGAGRPDIVLFVADTFRADNLSAYGGSPDLAPELDRFAEQSARFLRARSPAAWTLPALGTLFSGVLPGQHGATDLGLAVPRDLETVTEVLRGHGYRTGAITDSGFFTIAFGLDQGFEWFAEHQNTDWDLDRTIAEALAFLERDDGRPVFLVVHTYRVHAPYRRGPDEDQTEWDALLAEALATFEERRKEEPGGDLKREILLTFQDRLRDLYHAGVRDLDQGFGRFRAELERRGVLDGGYLLFTSDHGEALGENHDLHHGGKLWDVKLRIPLLIHGPGLEPADVAWSASLSDLAPTLAELAGLAPLGSWSGASLLSLSRERRQLAFRLEERHREVAVLEGDHKILALPDVEALRRGELTAAFDLARDPGEEDDLSGGSLDWPSAVARRAADEVDEALRPAARIAHVNTSPEVEKSLGEIGYGDR